MQNNNNVEDITKKILTTDDIEKIDLPKSGDVTNIILDLNTHISLLFELLINPTNFDDFVKFKSSINDDIIGLFHNELSGENENFMMALSSSDSNYLLDKSNMPKLEEFLLKKNRFYTYYLLIALEKGNLDLLLDIDDKVNLIAIIKTNIFNYFSDLYIIWNEELEKNVNEKVEVKKGAEQKLKYAGLKDGDIISYKKLLSNSEIKPEFLDDMTELDLKEYFKGILELIDSENGDFHEWIKKEHFALNTWEKSNSTFSINAPIEDYNKPGILVDMELDLFLKKDNNESKVRAIELSYKYFNDDYSMGETKFFTGEPILSGGLSLFKSVLGKSFPNDDGLIEERGTFIYSIDSRMGAQSLSKTMVLAEQFGVNNINENFYCDMSIAHTTLHEYGHSLFIKGNSKSDLEETKASLFFYLDLCDKSDKSDKNFDNFFNIEYINNFLDFSIIEIVRRFKNLDKPPYKQYLITERFIVNFLFKNGLINIDNGGNFTKEANRRGFKNFLLDCRRLLDNISYIYANPNEGSIIENKMLKELFGDTDMIANFVFVKLQNNND